MLTKTNRTYNAKSSEVKRQWLLVDAAGMSLGRLAAQVAALLRGKHKPIYTPHADAGDHVVVINADQVVLTGNKAKDKMQYRHSGYPGALKAVSYGTLLATKPDQMIRHAVKGMLPHTTLGKLMLRKLQVYRGSEHPHATQQPQPYDVSKRRA